MGAEPAPSIETSLGPRKRSQPAATGVVEWFAGGAQGALVRIPRPHVEVQEGAQRCSELRGFRGISAIQQCPDADRFGTRGLDEIDYLTGRATRSDHVFDYQCSFMRSELKPTP